MLEKIRQLFGRKESPPSHTESRPLFRLNRPYKTPEPAWKSLKNKDDEYWRLQRERTPPTSISDSKTWDYWWLIMIEDSDREDREPFELTPGYEPMWDILISELQAAGVKKVLCAGNGISQEPRMLAYAGFEATALDFSSEALEYAKAYPYFEILRPIMIKSTVPPASGKATYVPGDVPSATGGGVTFVQGDIMDASVCPGPFDAIITRCMLQYFQNEGQLEEALQRLIDRLSVTGVFVSENHNAHKCADDITSWLRAHNFAVEDYFKPRGRGFLKAPVGQRAAWQRSCSG